MPRVTAGEIELEYDEFGNIADPAIILVMGLGGQMILWQEEFCQGLADEGFRVIRFDNRDIGLSTKFEGVKSPNLVLFMLLREIFGYRMKTPYVLKDMAQDVIGLMDGLKIETAHIVGASMGGMIAQQLAIHHSERIESITAIMTSTLNPKLQQADPMIRKMLLTPAKNPDDVVEVKERALKIFHALAGPEYPVDPEVESIIEQSVERCNYPIGTVRQLLAISATTSMSEDLKNIDTPVLVIHGKDDKLVRVEAGQEIANVVPNSSIEIIDGMGHTLPRALYPRFIELITVHASKSNSVEKKAA